ncbi:MAG: amidohydrolase [Eubacteriales bacterium]|nr:amidohydrolase [Eubacteriales bacterium]
MNRTVYFNGSILTMEKERETVGAVVTQDGRITGTKAAASVSVISGFDASCGSGTVAAQTPGKEKETTRFIDLKGAAMLPAFLDSHSHFSGYASAQLQVPLEEAVSFEEIADKIRAHIRSRNLPAGTWIIGKGYDHNQLSEHAHPTAALLDQAAPDNPVMLQHQSCHMGVFNTMALRMLGVTAQTPCPSGGRIAIENGQPTGYMEENAFIAYQQKVPMPSMADLAAAYLTVQDKYASYGITTVQEGMLPDQLLPLYQMLLERDMLKLDVVGFADAKEASGLLPKLADYRRTYKNHFKLGGLKIFLDGSPQGRTAWMRSPYADSDDYCGYNTLTDRQAEDFIRLSVKENLQILAHCNGDAAAAQYLRACSKIEAEGLPLKALRPVLVHGQLLGPDQIPELKRLGVIPSFFAAHVYYWGDAHIRNFGIERASHISPAAAALRADIPFTFHQDTPVIEPDMLETIWCSVNRLTKGGSKLTAEAIPVMDALRAVTINAAYQYFEENEKGSIRPGKRADFVILDKNPLTVPPTELKNIRVLQTIKDGEIIYECR